MIRDRLLARMVEMGNSPDHQRLVTEVLGIRGAPPDLARKLVAQALVVEDRRDVWRQLGDRICAAAPAGPGVYVLKDVTGRVQYVGKAINVRRRLRAHFADRGWRGLKAPMARVAGAEWIEVGSELEALLREATLIQELDPAVNVQTGTPNPARRVVRRTLVRDVVVVVPSVDAECAELVLASADGRWKMARVRRDGSDAAAHARRIVGFFGKAASSRRSASSTPTADGPSRVALLAPLVYSWLSSRGQSASRLDPHASSSASELAGRLAALLRDERLFVERLEQR